MLWHYRLVLQGAWVQFLCDCRRLILLISTWLVTGHWQTNRTTALQCSGRFSVQLQTSWRFSEHTLASAFLDHWHWRTHMKGQDACISSQGNFACENFACENSVLTVQWQCTYTKLCAHKQRFHRVNAATVSIKCVILTCVVCRFQTFCTEFLEIDSGQYPHH